MAPRIRGIAPPIKRRTSMFGLGVNSPQKKISKGQTELDLSTEKLQKGEVVDVRLEESGLHGSWHPAVICGIKQGFRQVEFKNLLGTKNNPVKEWVRFGKEAVGAKQPLGTRKVTNGKPVLRPGGPGFPPAEPSFRKTGGWPKDLWVEVYSEEAWWEGVLVEDISASQMDEEDSVVDVIFPHLDDLIEQVALKNLRECKDWNEETGLWSIRGRLGKENDPMRTMPPGSLACEGVAATGNGGGARQDDEDADEMEGTGEESSKSAAQDDRPSTKKLFSIVKAEAGIDKYYGRLIDVIEEERRYLVRMQTLHYTLDEIQIDVQKGYISLDVTSENIETEIGNFTHRVHNVCCAFLQLPGDKNIDHTEISWKLHNEVLTIVIPFGGEGNGGKESVSPAP